MKALPTDWKFVTESISPGVGLTSANRYTPRTEYIRLSSSSKLPMFAIAGKLIINVIRLLFSALFFLKK